MRIKLDKADIAFSQYIRERDNWTCQRCKRKFPPKTQGLHCSHYFGRGNECTRFDPENCDALCMGCHSAWDSNKEDYRDFKVKQLGEERFKALRVRASSICKKDRTLAYIKIKAELERLKNLINEQKH